MHPVLIITWTRFVSAFCPLYILHFTPFYHVSRFVLHCNDPTSPKPSTGHNDILVSHVPLTVPLPTLSKVLVNSFRLLCRCYLHKLA